MICKKSAGISSFIVFVSGLLVCTVVSSANKSQYQCFKKRGKSLTKRRNRVDRRIDPWGTLDLILEKDDVPLSYCIVCCRDSRYEINQRNDALFSLYTASFL